MQVVQRFLRLCILAVPLLGGCANLPIWTEDQESEIARGDAIHKQILERTPEYSAHPLAEYVSTVGKKVATASDCANSNWQFTVLDSSVENAFATIGGHVYITRGLLIYLRNESDLAAILAHEVAHICRHDSIHAGRRSDIAGVAALGVILAAPELLLIPSAVAAPFGMGLSAMSRGDETAADKLGATYVMRAGYRPEAMRDALDVIVSIEAYKKSTGQASDGFWHRVYADHPSTNLRQERLSNLTSVSPDAKESADRQFLALLDGVEVGNSAEVGIAYKGKRYFPDFDISVEIPAGWEAHAWRNPKGQPTQLGIRSKNGEGVVIVRKLSVLEVSKEACTKSIETLFERDRVENVVPLHTPDVRACTAVGLRTQNGMFAKRSYRERVAVMEFDSTHYFAFRAVTSHQKEDEFNNVDQTFLAIARSIEPLGPRDKAPERPRLHIYEARSGDSFEVLGNQSALPIDHARFLRAINLRAEQQEPVAGDIVKIVR